MNQEQDVSPLIISWYTDNSTIASASYKQVKGLAAGFTNLEGLGVTVLPDCDLHNFQEAPASISVGPQIWWKTNDITGQTASAVVGQQVVLRYTFSPPPGTTVKSQSWSAGGTAVGGYNATSSSGAVVDADFSQATATFYWVYPSPSGSPFSVSVTVNLSDGSKQTGAASFNISGGGTMANTHYGQVTIDNLQPCGGGQLGPFMVYGNATGTACLVDPGSTFGMLFTPSGAPSGGTYSYVQLLNADVTTFTPTTGNNYVCTYTPGVDGSYPYKGLIPNSNPVQAEDVPTTQLPSQTYPTVNRGFNATMFLLWAPPSPSIPVPIGYQEWAFNGTANCPGSCGTTSNWKATTNGTPGPVGSFTPSNGSQTTDGHSALKYGFPLWSGGPATQKCR